MCTSILEYLSPVFKKKLFIYFSRARWTALASLVQDPYLIKNTWRKYREGLPAGLIIAGPSVCPPCQDGQLHNLSAPQIPSLLFNHHQPSHMPISSTTLRSTSRTNYCINSFYPKTIHDWNNLPTSVFELDSINAFQRNLL